MGGGSWDTRAYHADTSARRNAGVSDFGHHVAVREGRAKGIHPLLDPKGIAKSIAGVREARDSAEHPASVPIAIMFDVTGSMGHIPQMMQQKLPHLMDVILRDTGLADPQILMGAIGDYHSDDYPVQIGQFESDNRFDEQLRQIILEGGGGGQVKESYGHAFYFASRLTATDAWDKRRKKGYLFTIGDEAFWPELSIRELQTVYDNGAETALSVETLIREASERWELFHLIPTNTTHGRDARIQDFWHAHLGERVILLDNADQIAEVIASTIHQVETARGIGVKTTPTESSVASALRALAR